MKKIIVPTDFSENAQHALIYAKQLAEIFQLSIKVIHVCHPEVVPMNEIVGSSEIETLKKMREQQLSIFIKKVPHQVSESDLVKNDNIEQEVIIGFAGDVMLEYSERKDTAMIVMGKTGEGGVLTKMFGSISSRVSQKAKCPVWLVPLNADFKGIKNIMYACSFDDVDNVMVQKLIEFAKPLNSGLHLVHVNEKGREKESKITNIEVEKIITNTDFNQIFTLNVIQSDSVWEGLYEYAAKESIDLGVLVSRERSFWDKLINKHHSSEIIRHTEIPLLVMHLERDVIVK